jgi:hypothetical protein
MYRLARADHIKTFWLKTVVGRVEGWMDPVTVCWWQDADGCLKNVTDAGKEKDGFFAPAGTYVILTPICRHPSPYSSCLIPIYPLFLPPFDVLVGERADRQEFTIGSCDAWNDCIEIWRVSLASSLSVFPVIIFRRPERDRRGEKRNELERVETEEERERANPRYFPAGTSFPGGVMVPLHARMVNLLPQKLLINPIHGIMRVFVVSNSRVSIVNVRS